MPIIINGTTYFTKMELAKELSFDTSQFYRLEKDGILTGEKFYYRKQRLLTLDQARVLLEHFPVRTVTVSRRGKTTFPDGAGEASEQSVEELLASLSGFTGSDKDDEKHNHE